ncbi:hypothetical protein D3P07_08575 [Paenibacillus sp. 1011MAR3C5]|uniref:hypothetical protein n=1 Tax=Paenibacillus sp. 1011MAR3C5 TaxID=1675787 RepID=UPI000E6D248E|nr:hypothetical protein [Paenibacillus sp. 1011MAR3C5]RJE90251.1 hypothetical protein D3P07_08575 [Paenibacillus sp. 1011MAR3C5]
MKSKWDKWELTRAKGKKNYVLWNGVLGWGIPTGILFTALSTYINHKEFVFNQDFYQTLFLSLVLFSLGGVVFGLWTWSWTEKLYRKNKGE